MTRQERLDRAREVATAARNDLRLKSFPTVAEDQSLVEWAKRFLGTGIFITNVRVQAAKACWVIDHWEILLPDNVSTPFVGRRQLIHEIGHCLLSREGLPVGLGGEKEIVDIQRAEDEIVEVFVCEWLLPGELTRKYLYLEDGALARMSCCDPDYVRRRREELTTRQAVANGGGHSGGSLAADPEPRDAE